VCRHVWFSRQFPHRRGQVLVRHDVYRADGRVQGFKRPDVPDYVHTGRRDVISRLVFFFYDDDDTCTCCCVLPFWFMTILCHENLQILLKNINQYTYHTAKCFTYY